MSRVGKKPVEIPKGVTVNITDDSLAFKGPKGELKLPQNPLVSISQQGGAIVCEPKNTTKPARSAHGLMRALCANSVQGVSSGFARQLEINGVGYRAEVKGDTLVLQLGYSHPIEYKLPKGIAAKVDKNMISLMGIDKHALGAAAANIRGFRPPEPYKGKGIKYKEETILRKEGKAAGK